MQTTFWIIAIFSISFAYLFYKRTANYIKNFIGSTNYYIVLILVTRVIFNPLFKDFSSEITRTAIIISCVTIIGNLIFYVIPKQRHSQTELSKTIQYIYFDYRYLITNTTDIIFQQIMTVTVLLFFIYLGMNKQAAILTFGLLFTIAHLIWFIYMCKKQHTPIIHANIINILSFIGSFIMAFLILEVPSGFIYSFLVHSTTYTFLGLYFRSKHTKLSSNFY